MFLRLFWNVHVLHTSQKKNFLVSLVLFKADLLLFLEKGTLF